MTDGPGLLRSAWGASTGSDVVDRLRRRSLASAAAQSPHLEPVARALALRGRSQLDLHIEGGAQELHHETSASALGDFLTRVSHAVREIAKSGTAIERLHGDLSVLAPSPGSVRVVFLEQEAPTSARTQRSDAWADGMQALTATFDLAQSGSDSLDASMQKLSVGARDALRALGQTVAARSWTVAGELVSRDGQVAETRLNGRGADRLVDAARRIPTVTAPLDLMGVVDGWRWSNSVARLVPEHGSAIEAFVPRELAAQVAELNTKPGTKISAHLTMTETTSPRGGGRRRSYALERYEILPDLFADRSQQ